MNITLSLLAFVVITSASTAFAGGVYDCELKAREDFMHDFEVVTGKFDGSRTVEMTVKDSRLKLQTVGPNGVDQIAMLLESGARQSAVSLVPLNQQSIYLNLLQGEYFAVGTCTLRAVATSGGR